MLRFQARVPAGAALLICTLPICAVSKAAGTAGPPLAERLSLEGQAAIVRGRLAEAAVLFQGAWEIGGSPGTAEQLAQVYSMAGQFEEATDAYRRLLSLKPAEEVATRARQEMARLKNMPAPFTDELFARPRVTAFAKLAFAEGVRLVKRRAYEPAIRFLRAALVLDAELPGPYRLLGAIYGKRKDPAREQEFLLEYLRIRPDGAIAAEVRKRLQLAGLLGRVQVTASSPCRLWVNGRAMDLLTPVKELLLSPGSHTLTLVNAEYHLIRNMRVQVKRGETVSRNFDYGILVIKVEPWARVRVNNRDLGLWTEIGLPASTYQVSLVAHDGSRTKKLEVQVRPAQRHVIERW